MNEPVLVRIIRLARTDGFASEKERFEGKIFMRTGSSWKDFKYRLFDLESDEHPGPFILRDDLLEFKYELLEPL